MTAPSRLGAVFSAAVVDAAGRTRTWTVAGWTVFFVVAAARVLVPARSDGGAGLSVFGAELLGALGRAPEAPAAGLPIAILAALLIALPVAGFALAHGPMATHLQDRRLRLLALRCSRRDLFGGRVLGDGAVLAIVALLAGLLAVLNGEQRSAALTMEGTLAPGVGVCLLASLYGFVFVLAGHLVAIAGRGRRVWLIGALAVLVLLVAIRDVPGLGLLSPFGMLGGLLSEAPRAAAAGLAALSGLVGAAGWMAFRRLEL